ncbi:MAG: DUF4982 domain-containing protein [Sedimentisphaerales bacterium]|nr:DUF4982 domain-containing protein [Sedimentisphaerales bacterium]
MTRIYLMFAAVCLTSPLYGGRILRDFNTGWRFAQGEQGPEARSITFDDSAFETIRLPHDWAIRGPFAPEENGYAGKLPWKGVGLYRKVFTIDSDYADKKIYLDFDGVMAFPKVYINGQLAGQWDYGYNSFRVDVTPFLNFKGRNVVAVEVDTRRQGTRWYPGAGIYRKVMMTICDSVHLGHWSTYVTTPQLTHEMARVRVQTTIENHSAADASGSLRIELFDPAGVSVGQTELSGMLAAQEFRQVEYTFEVDAPRRWDIESPILYTAKVAILRDGLAIDTEEVSFGIRTFEFTADDGFYLNGRRVQLYGVNLHHDHGPLGAQFYPRAMERQLEIMREMGVNSIRTSHNVPAPELLDMCDRMGLLVWDECFDKWDDKAGRVRGEPPLEQYGEKQIRSFVMRDRNHPSIVVWSIGNEIGNQPGDREGKSPERVAYMRDFVLKYDDTRPVGMACHIPATADQPILDSLDLTGWNYARRYATYRKNYPDKPIIYTESASALSTRGFYELPLPMHKTDFSDTHQVDSYDLNAAPWSDIPDVEFKLMEDDRFVAGEMVWTGFDYLGEPTPFDQQARSSYFGIVDLCGIPKDRYYLYRSHWRPDTTTVHILPHWNWPDRMGKSVPVFVYTNGDSAELFLNGKSLGRRTKGEIPQQASNYAEGKQVAASSEETARGNTAACVADSSSETRWCADSESAQQWLQVDLGEPKTIGFLTIEFEREAGNYGYEVRVSDDKTDWQTIVTKPAVSKLQPYSPRKSQHAVDSMGRYVRIVFTGLRNGIWASVREFGVYPGVIENDYYHVTYRYRLRWNDVTYQPGELRAVAYKNGKEIGTAVMRTAGKPASIRLTPDRTKLIADGWDLSYVLVEVLDKDGNICPLADSLIKFKVQGPAEIAGVGNGNPLSLEPFQADYRRLFNGKAMLILRTQNGRTGTIRVTASSTGLDDGMTSLTANP